MPWIICPTCGSRTHLNTGDPAGFEARHHELFETGIALKVCWLCEVEIKNGDEVVVVNSFVRRTPKNSVPIGTIGIVEAQSKIASGHSIYRIRRAAEGIFYCLRGEIYGTSHLTELEISHIREGRHDKTENS